MKVSNEKSFLIFLTEEQFMALGHVLMRTDPSNLELVVDRPPVARLLHELYITLATWENGRCLSRMREIPTKGKVCIDR